MIKKESLPDQPNFAGQGPQSSTYFEDWSFRSTAFHSVIWICRNFVTLLLLNTSFSHRNPHGLMMCGRCNCECSLERWLRVADLLWVWFVVGPLAIFYWGGTWKLMDDYLVPHEDDTKTSAYISLAIGATVGFIAYMILPFVEETVEVRCHWKHVTVSRIIIYIQNFSTVNFWRGVWYLMDSYVGAGLTPSLVALCLSLLFLLVLRATSTAIATPFTINLDTRTTFYHTAPLFRSTVSRWVCARKT